MISRFRPTMRRAARGHFRAPTRIFIVATLIVVAWVSRTGIVQMQAVDTTYTNPLTIEVTTTGPFESCPDPAVIHGQQAGDLFWYMYCTTNPLNDADRSASGRLNGHFLPMLRSRDLIHWTYMGDVFSDRPAWLAGFSGLWAPDIQFFNDQYYLYYTTNGTQTPGRGSAIGVATSPGPTGPWTDSGGPVVEPQALASGGRSGRWIYDPAVATDESGQRYLFYGSFVGGVSARRLSPDGLHTDPATDVPIAAANRYEGVSVVKHDGAYFMFASAGECCNGLLSGYSVFVGRATTILGPYVDRAGVSLLAGRVGGTPVLSANGNRWIGPGHNTVLTDFAGQDWMLYHAVDRDNPYFAGTNITKRPVLLDPLDWVDGWPIVRQGLGPSDTAQRAPAAQPGESYRPVTSDPRDDLLGKLDPVRSIDFSALLPGDDGAFPTSPTGLWGWIRPPSPETVNLAGGTLRFATQAGTLEDHRPGILTVAPPAGDYIVETRVRLDVPPEGCCQNFVQAGLVIYGDDGNYLELAHLSREQTRQIVFTKAVDPVPPRTPHTGNAVVGSPDTLTYLRIVKRTQGDQEVYTAYSSRDGVEWTRGSTWTDTLGANARVGIVAMGGTGFTANFDYIHFYTPPSR